MNYDNKCDPPICFYPTTWTALLQMSSESPFSHASSLCSWPFSIMFSQTDPYEMRLHAFYKRLKQLLPKLYIPSPSTYKIRCVHTHTHTHMAFFLCSLFFSRTGNEAIYCICSMYTRMKSKSQPFYIRFISLVNGVIPGL